MANYCLTQGGWSRKHEYRTEQKPEVEIVYKSPSLPEVTIGTWRKVCHIWAFLKGEDRKKVRRVSE